MSEPLKITARAELDEANENRQQSESASWLRRIRNVWRGIAGSFSSTVRADLSSANDIRLLREQMQACLDARGGEVSARARAALLGETYLGLDDAGRRRFLQLMASGFEIDRKTVDAAIEVYHNAGPEDRLKAEARLRRSLQPKHMKLLMQFNALPQGVKFLVDMRSDIIRLTEDDPFLLGLGNDLRELLSSWFDIGFLELQRISWDHPAALLEKLIAYEAVHAFRGWDDLKNRLESDRRCFAFFHPRMPQEPLIFVQVALVNGMSDDVSVLLDESLPVGAAEEADTAIFYSISNAQSGLAGISFGGFLIKRVVDLLHAEFPGLKTFATLSPLPGFRRWLSRSVADGSYVIPDDAVQGIRSLHEATETKNRAAALDAILDDPRWTEDDNVKRVLEPVLKAAAAHYLAREKRSDGRRARDPVAHFHLTNGARIERLNWLGDSSSNGLRQAAGLMVNYLYDLEKIEENHEAYSFTGDTALSSGVKRLL
jgi:malonyl-CoA decarboxylase